MMTIREVAAKQEDVFGKPADKLPPWGGTESWLAAKKALKLGFTMDAQLECVRATGGAPDPDSRRGFGPTGHTYRVHERGRVALVDV
ncbi:MAG: hypothetical protein PHQ60_15760 [Sideroxydans sp.]|nr:hypothetical protein [Sideroxydans sp.]